VRGGDPFSGGDGLGFKGSEEKMRTSKEAIAGDGMFSIIA